MAKYKIAEARIAKGWTQSDLAEKIGTTQQQVARYESGANDVKSSVLLKMSEAMGVTIAYLLGLSGDELTEADKRFVSVSLYGSIAAGTPIEMIEAESTHPIPVHIHNKYPNAFLLKVEGNSMDRILPDGCYALIDPCNEITHDNEPYAICVNGHDATVKRVRKLAHGFQLIPDSTDPTYTPKTYNYNEEGTEQITVIGQVVWFCIPFDWEF